MMQTETALISLVDSNRQWFKSIQGLGATETSREVSFCGHAILDDKIFVVPNAVLDERFADNPLVVGAPSIRFYAGVPLSGPDKTLRIGTLCVLGPVPRTLTDGESQILKDLAAVVESELTRVFHDESTKIINESRNEGWATIESSSDLVIRASLVDRRIVYCNSMAASRLGYSQEEVGKLASFATLLAAKHFPELKEIEAALTEMNPENNRSLQVELTLVTRLKQPCLTIGSVTPVFQRGLPVAATFVLKDVTAQVSTTKRLQAVLDNATHVSIITTDTKGNITGFNSGAENLLQ